MARATCELDCTGRESTVVRVLRSLKIVSLRIFFSWVGGGGHGAAETAFQADQYWSGSLIRSVARKRPDYTRQKDMNRPISRFHRLNLCTQIARYRL